MTKKEREGLEPLFKENVKMGQKPEVNAALDWIAAQLALDTKRRKRRGTYRKLP